jgi:hypothetical protein
VKRASVRTRSRREAEASIITGLDWMRVNEPKSYAKMMWLLARLVAQTRAEAKAT